MRGTDDGCLGSVRFAPPLVIEEADLLRAVKIIGECLVDLDKVRVRVHLGLSWALIDATSVL